MSDDPLAEFRQGYKTLSERAEERKAAAQAWLQQERSRPVEDGPVAAPEPRWRVWFCTDGQSSAYVKCPSKSGAKIYLCEQHGWGSLHINAIPVSAVPEGNEILTAKFRTVLEANADDGYRRSK